MKCSVSDCDKLAKTKGWCTMHYSRWYKNGDPLVSQRMRNKGQTCKGEGCDRPAVAKLLCQMHHQRLQNNGDPDVVRKGGANDTRWRGGKSVTKEGYVYIWIDKDDPLYVMTKSGKNYALEHRVVMARQLGRPLEASETVHHINGDRLDNRIENLQLRSGSHGQGVVLECCACGSKDIKTVAL